MRCRRVGTTAGRRPFMGRRNDGSHLSLAPWYWKHQYIIRICLNHITERRSVRQRQYRRGSIAPLLRIYL
jgi:hypothetical protein